jgi:RNA polymerase sigma-B factor
VTDASEDEAERVQAMIREEFREYHLTRDRVRRDRLIEHHRPLAARLAKRFAYRGEPLEDLTQVAMIALLKAVERFDPDRNVEFTTFATPTILGELKRHFRDTTWMVRVPRRRRELHLAVRAAVGPLSQRLGRHPDPSDLAEVVGCSPAEVMEALRVGAAYQSVRFEAADGRAARALEPYLGADETGYDTADSRSLLSGLLRALPDRERRVVELRFDAEMTQSQIANVIGVSQMQVSRLLSRSLAHMREEAERTLAV